MASNLYTKAKELLMSKQLDLVNDTIRAALIDLNTYGLTVTAASFTNPIQMTTAVHGMSEGQLVALQGVLGNLAANGVFVAQNVGAQVFQLIDPITGKNIIGSGSYTSGGRLVRLGKDTFRSDLSGVIALSGPLTTKVVAGGIFDADDTTFLAVAAGSSCSAVVLYKDTGNASTDPLISFHGDLTGLPVTTNGGDITINWDTARNKVFAL